MEQQVWSVRDAKPDNRMRDFVSQFDVYEATVLWDGQPLPLTVDEADSDPLVGMALMYGYELVLPVMDGATFTLRRIATP